MVPARYRQNILLPINSLLEEFFGDMNPECSAQVGFKPPLDWCEDEGHCSVQLELPGMKKEEVKISLEENVLTIRGEKKREELLDKEEYRRVERNFGVFERSFMLPKEIREDAICAEMKNGILKIRIQKTEKVEPHKITINWL